MCQIDSISMIDVHRLI